MSNMKLVAFVALGILAGSQAFATRAKTLVMGTGDGGSFLNGGSFYFDDENNMFYNPAAINDFKNWATIEKSNGPTATTAEGGFVTSMGGFNFGAYLNRGDAVMAYPGYVANFGTAVSDINQSTAYTSGTTPARPLEIFFGGDMGAKWGLGLHMAKTNNGLTASTGGGPVTYTAVSLGADFAGLQPFGAFQFIGQDTNKDKKHSFWRVGTRYKWGEWVPYAALQTTKYKDSTTLATAGAENKEFTWGLGFGRNTKIGDAARLNYALSFWRVKDTTKATSTSTEVTGRRTIVPLDISVEGDAASWITLRAGLSYRAWDRVVTASSAGDVADNTTGRFGATIHAMKNADFDFALGTHQATAATDETSASVDNQTYGLGAGFIVAASGTFRW